MNRFNGSKLRPENWICFVFWPVSPIFVKLKIVVFSGNKIHINWFLSLKFPPCLLECTSGSLWLSAYPTSVMCKLSFLIFWYNLTQWTFTFLVIPCSATEVRAVIVEILMSNVTDVSEKNNVLKQVLNLEKDSISRHSGTTWQLVSHFWACRTKRPIRKRA